MREPQVTRTTGVAFRQPDPRTLGQSVFWSAMLMDNTGTIIDPYGAARLNTPAPRHATNGDSDFDADDYPVVSIIIPFDGIYGVSAVAQFRVYEPAQEQVSLMVRTDSYGITQDAAFFDSNADVLILHGHRVGVPLSAGDRISLNGYNGTSQNLYVTVEHLEVTYFGPIGTLYPMKGYPS